MFITKMKTKIGAKKEKKHLARFSIDRISCVALINVIGAMCEWACDSLALLTKLTFAVSPDVWSVAGHNFVFIQAICTVAHVVSTHKINRYAFQLAFAIMTATPYECALSHSPIHMCWNLAFNLCTCLLILFAISCNWEKNSAGIPPISDSPSFRTLLALLSISISFAFVAQLFELLNFVGHRSGATRWRLCRSWLALVILRNSLK